MDELAELRQALTALAQRVARLEGRQGGSGSRVVIPTDSSSDDEVFWALRELKARHATTSGGVVMMVGALTLSGGAPVEWQQAADSGALIEAPWNDVAASLAALGHPVRLELLRHLLAGASTTAELAGIDGVGTTGQLHHHLRELVATGWAVQTSRGHYAVPATRIVPLLITISGVTP